MAEEHHVKSEAALKGILTQLSYFEGQCWGPNAEWRSEFLGQHTGKFVPKPEIEETSDGYKIRVKYVCTTCGAIR